METEIKKLAAAIVNFRGIENLNSFLGKEEADKVHLLLDIIRKDNIVMASIVCKPGDKCIARNYRTKNKEWEFGTVQFVNMAVKKDLNLGIQYRVILDRRIITQKKPWGTPLFLVVGDEDIKFDFSNPVAP